MTEKSKLDHTIPSWVPNDAVFFITINCAIRGKNSLAFPHVAQSLFQGMKVFQEQQKWWIFLALIMPDHLHVLATFSIQFELDKTVWHWKRYWSRRLGIEWQEDFFDHRIRSEDQYVEKFEYIRLNPVRKGLAKRPEEWPYIWMPSTNQLPEKRDLLTEYF